MKVKKHIVLLLSGIVGYGTIQSAYASDGSINFTGEITDHTCTVDTNSKSNTVDLGKISSLAFNGSGDTASTTKFIIDLTSCPSTITTARVKFDGANDNVDPALLAITGGTGAATGVALELMNSDKTPLRLNQLSNSYTLSSTGTNHLDFYAAYKSTNTTVTAGPANANATFTVVYN